MNHATRFTKICARQFTGNVHLVSKSHAELSLPIGAFKELH